MFCQPAVCTPRRDYSRSRPETEPPARQARHSGTCRMSGILQRRDLSHLALKSRQAPPIGCSGRARNQLLAPRAGASATPRPWCPPVASRALSCARCQRAADGTGVADAPELVLRSPDGRDHHADDAACRDVHIDGNDDRGINVALLSRHPVRGV